MVKLDSNQPETSPVTKSPSSSIKSSIIFLLKFIWGFFPRSCQGNFRRLSLIETYARGKGIWCRWLTKVGDPALTLSPSPVFPVAMQKRSCDISYTVNVVIIKAENKHSAVNQPQYLLVTWNGFQSVTHVRPRVTIFWRQNGNWEVGGRSGVVYDVLQILINRCCRNYVTWKHLTTEGSRGHVYQKGIRKTYEETVSACPVEYYVQINHLILITDIDANKEESVGRNYVLSNSSYHRL